ncbi:cytochrome p450 89a2 [Quercus suber]|uniref:Cytochrome p450 89a2 n=1 Tax=Quercus suber TaxID=58331 RepID=A0AAW0IWR7_QUESU
METWFIIVISLYISALLKSLLNLTTTNNKVSENNKLPPGPYTIPIIGNFLWLRKPFSELELIIRKLQAKYGPIITIYIGFRPAIFVADRSLAHKALVQNGAVFADRPTPPPTDAVISSNQHNISSAYYGPTWRLFRRNLSSEILHPSRVKSYSHARKWVWISSSTALILSLNPDAVLRPLVEARRKVRLERRSKVNEDKNNDGDDEFAVSYVDTLLDLELPEEKRKLSEKEIASLCSSFSTRGLRRHPPGHFVLPHAVTEDVVLDGYLVPKNATLNFMVAEMGWDSRVWEDPMEFKPERFLSGDGGVFDITGSREIKMMPFGAGRRICPASGLAILHLEYFVANLVWNFEWKAVDGDEVDLSEKLEFTMVMKNPLKAHLSPRL